MRLNRANDSASGCEVQLVVMPDKDDSYSIVFNKRNYSLVVLSGGVNMKSELDAIMEEARERGVSIGKKSYSVAECIIKDNPDNPPSVGLEPDGGILLEWYKPSIFKGVFSVILKNDALIWAHLGEDNVLGHHGVVELT